MKDLLKIKINKTFAPHEAGTIINIPHNQGVPLDKYWRDRIRDSQIDDCVTVIQPSEKIKSAKVKIDREV